MTTRSIQAPVRFGVVGCGTIAYWRHLRILPRLQRARLVAAADPDAAAARRARRLTGIEIHDTAEALLDRKDIDAVVICVPSHLSAEIADRALRSGKAAYVEKPVATSVETARHLAETAEDSSQVLTAGFNRRFHPLTVQAHRLIADGRLGSVHSILSSFSEPLGDVPGWRDSPTTGGGVLLDLGIHHFDLIAWLVGQRFSNARGLRVSATGTPEAVAVEGRLEGGTVTQSFFSFQGARTDSIRLIGELGTLTLDRHRATLVVERDRRHGYGVTRRIVPPSAAVLGWWCQRSWRPSFDPSYRLALSAFTASVLGEPAQTSAGIDDAIRSLEVVALASLDTDHLASQGSATEAKQAAANGTQPIGAGSPRTDLTDAGTLAPDAPAD